jgi:hypothetical protein
VAITDGTDSHKPDDPTTSVNRNVTVPDGNPDIPIPKPYATSEHPPNKPDGASTSDQDRSGDDDRQLGRWPSLRWTRSVLDGAR